MVDAASFVEGMDRLERAEALLSAAGAAREEPSLEDLRARLEEARVLFHTARAMIGAGPPAA